ncbi:MAG TPA: glycolate oxidase subunit GlcE [Steroidobacteraceae bacterium]
MTTIADQDLTAALVDLVRTAAGAGTALRIVGGDTKSFYGRAARGLPLSVAGHTGIVTYDPAELVVTARAGTRLADLEALLQAHGQRLPFEPPAFGAAATIGGTVAAGLAGPARVARGPLRDYVLGARLLASDGRVLRFGGEVMKNVAGYDVARLLAGSLGILGVILEVSLKVLPLPAATRTLRSKLAADAAIERLVTATQRGVPVTGSFWCDGELSVRLEGSEPALDASAAVIGGDRVADDAARAFWRDVREQAHPFFEPGQDLWRIATFADVALPRVEGGRIAFEWNGMQRWAVGDTARQALSPPNPAQAQETLFRPARGSNPADREVFAPLPEPLLRLHQAVKATFDPGGIFNPGRMYRTL